MTDHEIKELVDKKLLKNVTDYAVQTVLRRVLFYNKNKIDWQDFYEQIVSQMPELRLETESYVKRGVNFVTNKILEGVDVRDAFLGGYISDITDRYPEGMYDLPDDGTDNDFEPISVKDVIKSIESDGSFWNCITVWKNKKKVGDFYKLSDLKKFANDFVHNWRWIDASIDLYLV